MRQLFRSLLLILITMFVVSCEDSNDGSNIAVDPIDAYEGVFKSFQLKQETKDFHHENFICDILAPDGSVISREGEHIRLNQISYLNFDKGLKSGVYRLLALKTEAEESRSGETNYNEYGLGCRIAISRSGEVTMLDTYDSIAGFVGQGTEDDPYIVSSYNHLGKIRDIINCESSNDDITVDTHFEQHGDIKMYYASSLCDDTLGWLPIGELPNNPFRGQYDGNGYSISDLWSKRPNSLGVGLFGFIEGSVISNITMKRPKLQGIFATGSIAGAVVSPGDGKLSSIFRGCKCHRGEILSEAGIGAGGLLGAVDMKSSVLIDSCSNSKTSVKGAYGVGGLLGVAALGSRTVVSNSNNTANIESTNTGAGGLVGSVDTLIIMGCKNRGEIIGSTNRRNSDEESCYGTGGLAGGAGFTVMYSCENSGDVTGYVGVGGIIGSSRIGSDMSMFNNVAIKTASNTGAILGESCVGGICGEAQIGGYALYNTGSVHATASSDSHVGGIAGNTAIALIYNSVNTGDVGTDCTSGGTIGGIVSKSNWGSFLTCQNFGNISGQPQYMGGVVALAGNNSMINFCTNAGKIHTTRSNNCIGGIVGALGDQREWSAEDISACVFGAMDVVLSFVGPALFFMEDLGVVSKHTGHKLHLTELGIGYIPVIGDTVLWGLGVNEMVNAETMEAISDNMADASMAIANEIRAEMDQVRLDKSKYTDTILGGLLTNTLNDFTESIISLNQFNESNDDNNAIVNGNMNLKREERMEELEERAMTKEIIQKAVSGGCILLIGVASVFSAVASAGSTMALTTMILISLGSAAGGVNSIIEGVTDYPENAVIVSQCANYGTISANNTENTGGIVGIANENCWIRDCLNISSYDGPYSRSVNCIVGNRKDQVIVERCLLIGDNWSSYYMPQAIDIDESIIYNTDVMEPDFITPLEDLCKVNTYKAKGWDISSATDRRENTKWVVKEELNNYPVPQRSEMVDDIEE